MRYKKIKYEKISLCFLRLAGSYFHYAVVSLNIEPSSKILDKDMPLSYRYFL